MLRYQVVIAITCYRGDILYPEPLSEILTRINRCKLRRDL